MSETTKKKTTYGAIAPDGTLLTRKSHRKYDYAVLVGPTDGHPGWGVWSFCGRFDLAYKAEAQARKAWAGSGAEIKIVGTQVLS